MITKEEVEHITKLARLELSAQEIGKMQKDLSEILDYFELLGKAPASGKAPLSQAEKKGNVLRKDEAHAGNAETSEKIIALAPDKKDGCIKVKAIF